MNFEIYIVAVIWICLVTKQKPGWPWLAQFLKKILQWSLSFKILDAMNAIFDQVKIYGNKSSIFWPLQTLFLLPHIIYYDFLATPTRYFSKSVPKFSPYMHYSQVLFLRTILKKNRNVFLEATRKLNLKWFHWKLFTKSTHDVHLIPFKKNIKSDTLLPVSGYEWVYFIPLYSSKIFYMHFFSEREAIGIFLLLNQSPISAAFPVVPETKNHTNQETVLVPLR